MRMRMRFGGVFVDARIDCKDDCSEISSLPRYFR